MSLRVQIKTKIRNKPLILKAALPISGLGYSRKLKTQSAIGAHRDSGTKVAGWECFPPFFKNFFKTLPIRIFPLGILILEKSSIIRI
jgi:hypothetical protein